MLTATSSVSEAPGFFPQGPPTEQCTADPDHSNPTRPRLERPLDTIRSFEAAIDGHNRRQSFRTGISYKLPSLYYPELTLGSRVRIPNECPKSTQQLLEW